MDQNQPPRRVSFHSNVAADSTSSISSNTPSLSNPPANRGRPSSSFGGPRLRPLTQLKDESVKQPTRKTSHEDHASFGSIHQSEHSRRGSMSANSMANSPRSSLPTPGLTTSSTSVPTFTLGARVRDLDVESNSHPRQASPHPYDVILPGEEQRRTALPTKNRALTTIASSTVGSNRIGSFVNQPRNTPIGARRFTQPAASFSHGSGTISSTGTANQAAALHARRFSTIAREPSVAVRARHSHGWSAVSDVDHPEEGSNEAKKSAHSDARILLNSFSSLMGQEGGGEAVGNFVRYILSGGLANLKTDVIKLTNKVLESVPALQAAYLTVHIHEILEQLQRVGGLLYAEPEIASMFSELSGSIFSFMSATQSAPTGVSCFSLLRKMMDKVVSLSIYKSAFLNLLDRVCQLIMASESVRDGLWSRLSDSLFGSQGATEQNEVRHIAEFLSLLFASIEQLTGSSIKPLVKSFVSWIALIDESSTTLASETRNILTRPPPATVPPSSDYRMHPLGYVYSPSDTDAKLDLILRTWSSGLFDTPTHKDVYGRFKRHLENVMLGIQGNSTFARFSRDLRRVWFGIMGNSNTNQPGTGIAGALECVKTLLSQLLVIPLGDVEHHDEATQLVFSNLDLSLVDELPSEFGFNAHSTFHAHDSTFRSSTSFSMKHLQLKSKSVPFTYINKSESAVEHTGTLDARFALDVVITLSPKDKALFHMFSSLPTYEGTKLVVTSADIKFYPTNSNTSNTIWPVLEKHLINSVQHRVTGWMESFFQTWLPTKSHIAVQTPKLTVSALNTPAQAQKLAQPSRTPETHGTARDRFKASIRDLTGLKTGSVLTHLQNPLSGPSSPLLSPAVDGESIDAKRKRRQSMADHLTDISKADSTLPQNIQRPPVASSNYQGLSHHALPNVFDEDDDEMLTEYDTMARSLSVSAERDTTSLSTVLRPVVSDKADFNSVLSHRGGMPLFPTGEMTYDAYQMAEASMGELDSNVGNLNHRELSSMAQSLSELTSRDTTIRETIEHPPTSDTLYHEHDVLGLVNNMTMDKVTRHLSGLPDGDDKLATDVSMQPKLIRSGSQPQGLIDKVIMADLLTEKLKADNTLPEHQATGDLAGPVSGLGVPTRPGLTRLPTDEVIPMGKVLNKFATVDTTLPENIASPPGHQPVLRHPSSRGSFASLRNVHPMSNTLDSTIEMDFTTPEGQSEMYRIYDKVKHGSVGAEQPVVGLTEQELKQRRQSFKLSDEAMQDTTLLETIRRPPAIDPKMVFTAEPSSAVEELHKQRKKSMNAGQIA
ncbi:hypothetical protein DFH28DRAFT_397245 [Melampsora americana]|nr:hypothetical protein DFH28DRAFT_397245 [Melampsora americana]